MGAARPFPLGLLEGHCFALILSGRQATALALGPSAVGWEPGRHQGGLQVCWARPHLPGPQASEGTSRGKQHGAKIPNIIHTWT